jgi:hypothetical protein
VRSVLFPVAAIFILAGAAFPQPAFEVSTIKPFDTTNGVINAGVRVYPGGRLVIHALSLKALIMAAYDVGYWQLSGGEDWMGKACGTASASDWAEAREILASTAAAPPPEPDGRVPLLKRGA